MVAGAAAGGQADLNPLNLANATVADEFRAAAVKTAQKDLAAVVSKAGLVRAETQVLGGDARLLIIEEAKARKSELVVVATHGVKGAKRIILGSVAEWVMTNAACDVLVTRG